MNFTLNKQTMDLIQNEIDLLSNKIVDISMFISLANKFQKLSFLKFPNEIRIEAESTYNRARHLFKLIRLAGLNEKALLSPASNKQYN